MKTKKQHKHWTVVCHNSYGSDPTYHVVHSKEEAVVFSHRFFLSYGFELRDGKPFDVDNDDGLDGGFKVFENVKMFKGKVLEFVHFGGDGPICEVRKESRKR